VPFALLAATLISPVIMGIVGVVSIWWDVYHSSLQTFGFGRIYDAKQKNCPNAGRRLDYWMNLFLYTGPVLAGAHFVNHLEMSRQQVQLFAVERTLFSDLLYQKGPDFLQTHQAYLAAVVLGVGVPFFAYYIYAYYQLQQQGYHVSWQKVWLLIITGAVSIYVWGFRSFIDAFWVMNFFHALQYFAIVLYMERANLARLFRVDQVPTARALALVWVVAIAALYGIWAGIFVTESWMTGIVLTTAIMHFWYDGFVWSVKKKQV
jgi:hypothetical protein